MVEWDRLAEDFIRHRQRYPDRLYEWLTHHDLLRSGLRALDLGAGTGDLARGLVRRGLRAVAVDPARKLLAAATPRPFHAVQALAEALPFPDDFFDLAVCASAWHWLDPEAAGAELRRVLRPGAGMVAAHFVWLPEPGTAGEVSNRCLLEFQDAYDQTRRPGRHPEWSTQLRDAGFEILAIREEDLVLHYDLEGWRGRLRASVPVRGRLDDAGVAAFDRRHAEALRSAFGAGLLEVPHRLFAVVARVAPAESA